MRVFYKLKNRNFFERGTSKKFCLTTLYPPAVSEDIRIVTAPGNEDITAQTFIGILKERETFENKDVQLLNRIIRNGGFTSYIKLLTQSGIHPKL